MRINGLNEAQMLCKAMTAIYNAGLTTPSGGNMSLRDENGNIWVTPSGLDKACYTENDIVKMCADGDIEGERQPSIEAIIHRAILLARPDLKAVVHAHSPGLLAVSILRELPDSEAFKDYVFRYGKVEIAPYACPGSWELREKVTRCFRELRADSVLLENHGAFVASSVGLEDACEKFKALEKAVRLREPNLDHRFMRAMKETIIGPVTLAVRTKAVGEMLDMGHLLPIDIIPEALMVFDETTDIKDGKLICKGADFMEAFDKVEVAEFMAEAYIQAMMSGKEIHRLSQMQVNEVVKKYCG